MNMDQKQASMEQLEAHIGYTFRNKALLRQAMTHSSYSNETGERNHHLLCNERLEFLGDAVLSILVSRYLYAAYPREREGILTDMRKEVVRAQALARYAVEIGLPACLLLGKGEAKSGGCQKENILADAFEALVAAIYLDAGEDGMEVINGFLLPLVKKDLTSLLSIGMDEDYKSLLQQLVQQTEGDVLEYEKLSEEGPDHKKTFVVEVRVNSNPCGRGVGSSIKKAEQAAAKEALKTFGICRDASPLGGGREDPT